MNFVEPQLESIYKLEWLAKNENSLKCKWEVYVRESSLDLSFDDYCLEHLWPIERENYFKSIKE